MWRSLLPAGAVLALLPVIASIALGIPSRAGPAEGQSAVQLRIEAIDTSQFPQIRATVSAIGADGVPLADLPSTGFSAEAGGVAVPVTGAAGSADPSLSIAVALVFDTSGSMQGAAIDEAKQAGRLFVNSLGPNDQAGIIAFATDVREVHPFTTDKQGLLQAIDRLSAGGNTALYSAVATSAQSIRQVNAPRKALVLLSDGQDFGSVSQIDRQGSIAAAAQAQAPFFLVGLGGSIDEEYLRSLAEATHGQLMLAPDPAALQGLYASIAQLLRQQYVLTLDASRLPRGQQLSLTIRLAYGGSIASSEIALDTPALPATQPPATPAPTPVPTQRPLPQQEPESAGSNTGLLVGAGVGAAALTAAVLLLARRWARRRRREPEAEGPEEAPVEAPRKQREALVFPALHPASHDVQPAAWLEVTSGSGDQKLPLDEQPRTIGFTPDCDIRLEDGRRGTRMERVRIWMREGRFMLHNLSALGTVRVSGQPATWIILEDGDEIVLGTVKLVFRSEGDKL